MIEDLKKFSQERIEKADEKYQGLYKRLSVNDLFLYLEEELADTLSYLSFISQRFNIDTITYENEIIAFHKKLKKEIMEENLLSFNGLKPNELNLD